MQNVQYKWYELPIFIGMGVIGGMLGAIFNAINIRLTKFRNHFVKMRYAMVIETLLVATMSAVIGLILIFYNTNDCQPLGRDLVSKYPIQVNYLIYKNLKN